MPSIRIEAGELTEGLAQFVLGQLDDCVLDEVEVKRIAPPPNGLVCEPATTALILTLSASTAVLIARAVERWLETRRQVAMMTIALDGFKHSDEAGKAMVALAKAHSQVSVTHQLPSAGSSEHQE